MTIISLFYCCEKVFILMNIWRIGKTSMKQRHLNMEDNTNADYAKRVCKDFKIKNLREYHDLFV